MLKYIARSLLFYCIISSLNADPFNKGTFESCETKYYTLHEVKFISSEQYSTHVNVHSELRKKVSQQVQNSFKKGYFESCGLMGCSIDYVTLR